MFVVKCVVLFFFFLVYRGLDMEMNMNDVDDDIVEVCVKYCWAMGLLWLVLFDSF